jgi:hypothetical protein
MKIHLFFRVLALEPGARPQRGGGNGCARALAVTQAVYKPPHQKKKRCVRPRTAGAGRDGAIVF